MRNPPCQRGMIVIRFDRAAAAAAAAKAAAEAAKTKKCLRKGLKS